jgi:hypothetical protein
MATNRIVSKKELEAFRDKYGADKELRDLLNKERGLVRRKEANPTLGEAKDKGAQEAADAIDPGSNMMFKDVARNQYRESGKEMVDKQDAESARGRSMSAYVPRRDPNAAARAMLSRGEGDEAGSAMKRGGAVKKMAKGGAVRSASQRADGCAQRGKTRA